MDRLIHGFRILSKTGLDEMQAEGIYARHEKTGLELYHIYNDDAENLFAFAFMTPPENSTGVPHILEHSVLCGSKHYPIKDPFAVLSKQSVKTFLNAMTFPDKTVYPAASTIEADYFHLLSVYGDAVFFPLLEKHTFEQEGWHYETGADGKTTVSGVVLNEMRGVYTDFESVVYQSIRNTVFDDTVYGHDSGGYPPDIISLQYEDFTAFHARYYHPGNCKVFLYGNIPTERQMAFLNNRFLTAFEPAPAPDGIPPFSPFAVPRTAEISAPMSEGKSPDKHSVIVTWVLPESASPDSVLDAILLEEVLMGHDGAPLQKRLLETPLSEDVYAYNGAQTELKNICFTIGLTDCPVDSLSENPADSPQDGTRNGAAEKAAAVEQAILNALRDILEEGISSREVETALHSIDFANREVVRSGGPFSLLLMRRCLRGWIHGTHPEVSLRMIPAFERLKERIAAAPNYIETLIRTLLLDNPCRTTVTVRPDPLFCKNIDAQLQEKIDSLRPTVPQPEENTQDTSSDAANGGTLIPHISKDMLPPAPPPIQEYAVTCGSIPVICHELPTNDISYIDLAFSADGFSEQEYLLLMLYSNLFGSVGTTQESWDTVAASFAYLTGGVSAVPITCSIPDTAHTELLPQSPLLPEHCRNRDWLLIRVKMLPVCVHPALDTVCSYIRNISFEDTKRLKDLIVQMKNDFDGLPSYAGHSLVSLHISGFHSVCKHIENLWQGIPQIRFLRQLYADIETKPESIAELAQSLTALHKKIIHGVLAAKVCTTKPLLSGIVDRLHTVLAPFTVPAHKAAPERAAPAAPPAQLTVFPSNVQVGFAALTIPLAYSVEEFGTAAVYAQLLETGILWEEIRGKGGAYGVYARANPLEGIFTITTYRDPQPAESITRIIESIRISAETIPDNSELEPIITGTYSGVLHPKTPAQRSAAAFSRHLNSLSYHIREKTIAGILSCTQEDIQRFAARLCRNLPKATAAYIGSETMAERKTVLKDLFSSIREEQPI